MELQTVLLHLEAEPNATIQPMELLELLELLELQALLQHGQMVTTLDQQDQMMHQPETILPRHRVAVADQEEKVAVHHRAQVVVVAVAVVEAAGQLEGAVSNLN